jgi:LuxR family maltose regulon positive regulatory protein
MDSRAAKPRARTAGRASNRAASHLELTPPVPAFDFLESKIRAPAARPDAVSRTALVNRLRATADVAVTTVVAPAGYGKTTLLGQWAERDSRPFAWVTVDERDNDPVVLLRHVAAALERHEPVKPSVVDGLRAPGSSIWTRAVPRLASELSARSPIVLVLDDFSLLRSRASLQAVAALIDDVGEGSMIAVAGRTSPRLPLAPLRAQGVLLELGPLDLAMSKREAQLLLRATGVGLAEAEAAELFERCEGWPAALHLGALSVRDERQGGREPVRLAGDDRYLADYFRSEYLSHLRPGPLRFMRRTAVLERMCGPLCDAVLRDDGSAAELEKMERANLFVAALDNRRVWFRYHPLFRDLLRRELIDAEPDFLPVLHGRAAAWYHAHGDDESALEHAFAAGDTSRAAAILAAIAIPVYNSGRAATLERWLGRFDNAALLERHPAVALHGARIHAFRGRTLDAERWLEAASGSSSAEISVLRALLCRRGAKQMLADAQAALDKLPDTSSWRPDALLAKGSALVLLGDRDRADEALASAAECATAANAAEAHVVAVGQRALMASDLGDHGLADKLSTDLHELVVSSRVEGYQARAVEHVTHARMQLRHGRWNDARTSLGEAQELLPFLTTALAWLAIQVRLELAWGFFTLRDVDVATQLVDEVDGMLRQARGLATLAARADELRKELSALPEAGGAFGASLTPAELRLLPLLATHLSFREIAEQLYVSRNTIKTQAISVYRKLGVASRSEAIAEAQRLGLGDHLRVVVTSSR